jgi:hypothetical protein
VNQTNEAPRKRDRGVAPFYNSEQKLEEQNHPPRPSFQCCSGAE